MEIYNLLAKKMQNNHLKLNRMKENTNKQNQGNKA